MHFASIKAHGCLFVRLHKAHNFKTNANGQGSIL